MRLPLLPVALACCSLLLGGCGGAGGTTVAGGMNALPAATPPPVDTTGFRYTAAPGKFYKNYTGPKRPALDVIAADGALTVSSQTISITAKMAGPVFDGNANYYVFAFDTLPPRPTCFGCGGPIPDEPNIRFTATALVVAYPGNGGTVNGFLGSFPDPVKGEFATLVDPNTVRIDVPVSDLASLLPPEAIQWNVWARSGFLTFSPGTTEIASFLPDNAMATLLVR